MFLCFRNIAPVDTSRFQEPIDRGLCRILLGFLNYTRCESGTLLINKLHKLRHILVEQVRKLDLGNK